MRTTLRVALRPFFRDWYMSKPLDALFFVFCAGYSFLHDRADRLHKVVWTSIMLLPGLFMLTTKLFG